MHKKEEECKWCNNSDINKDVVVSCNENIYMQVENSKFAFCTNPSKRIISSFRGLTYWVVVGHIATPHVSW